MQEIKIKVYFDGLHFWEDMQSKSINAIQNNSNSKVFYVRNNKYNTNEIATLESRSSDFCIKFFLANERHFHWQPFNQSFTLRLKMEPIGQFGQIVKQEFHTKLSPAQPLT